MEITFASMVGHARDGLQALGGASLVLATTLVLGFPAAMVFAGT